MTEISIIRSSRRTLSVQIKADGTICVRAPFRMPEHEIYRFLEQKADWITEHLNRIRAVNQAAEIIPLSQEELHNLANAACADLPQRVQKYAAGMGITYGKITIRNQRTRWGSCSSQGNLNFNCLLMLAPEAIRDYVVVHELAHRRHMDHSTAFWLEVESILPDYKARRKWLKDNGGLLMARMSAGK